jgi:hypothetical protein
MSSEPSAPTDVELLVTLRAARSKASRSNDDANARAILDAALAAAIVKLGVLLESRADDERDGRDAVATAWPVSIPAENVKSSTFALTAADMRLLELDPDIETLLDGVALAFKGPPAPLHRHSWHDLPAIAERVMRDREALRDAFRLTAKLKATESYEQAVFLVGYLTGVIGRYTQPLKADDGPATTTA